MNRRALGRILVVLLMAATAPGCATRQATAGGAAGAYASVERLYMGRNIPGGGTVDDAAWSAFVQEVVTPRFPDGFTVWSADGQWRGASGVVERERVMVLEVYHDSPDAARRIGEIAAEYRRRFRQEAVLRVTAPARFEFVR